MINYDNIILDRLNVGGKTLVRFRFNFRRKAVKLHFVL